MKAIFYNQTGSIDFVEFDSLPLSRPDLGGKEVRVRVLAGSLNHLDLWVLKGLPHISYQFPHIMGADVVARVMESRSERFKVDDRVLVYPASVSAPLDYRSRQSLQRDFAVRGENAPGLFCEELILSERELFHCPAHLEITEAAAVPLVYLTAWQMIVEKAQIQLGQSPMDDLKILIHGAGSGVSHALLEILLSFGLKSLVLSSRSEEKLRPWRDRGVEGVLADESFDKRLKELAGPEGFDVIFDHVGQAYWSLNLKRLRNGGRLVTCGATSGFHAELDLRHVFFRQIQILGSTMGEPRHFQDVLDWIQMSRIRPRVSEVFAFHEISKALEKMDKGGQDGKIVCQM